MQNVVVFLRRVSNITLEYPGSHMPISIFKTTFNSVNFSDPILPVKLK